jgi:DNA repair ATPase RecN
MDEATLARIAEIVKSMHAQGMTQSEIRENLKQMGVADQDAEDIIRRAEPEVTMPEVHEKVEAISRKMEEGEHLKPAMEKLEEHEEHFERLHATVGELHEKHDELREAVEELHALREDIDAIKADLKDMKPMLAALKRINEQMIELERKTLARKSAE